MISCNTKTTALLLCTFAVTSTSKASDAFVETDFEAGKGIFRPVGKYCFVYTPSHVVESSDTYFISSRHVKDAEASLLTSYPQDLAILQLPIDHAEMCRDSSWQSVERVAAILEGLNKATLSFRRKSGSLTEYPLRISKVDLHTYFYVQLENVDTQIMQGMSGSIVMVGEYPIGMLVSVEGGEGKVLRMDSMADISESVMESFMSEQEIAAKNSSDLSAYPSLSANKSINQTENVSSGYGNQEFTGSISNGTSKEYTVFSRGHTAYRFTSAKQSENVRILVSFYSPGGKKLYSSHWYTGDKTFTGGFGTVDEGEHKLVIQGYGGGVGTYNIKLEEMATPEQLTGESNVLAHGGVAKGHVATNTEAVYSVFSRGNTAYRFTSAKQSDDVRILVSFYSPGGKKLYSSHWYTGNKTITGGFGTVDEGEHKLVIQGYGGGVGTYNIKLEEVK
ncbi:hypothetical protein HJ160_03805 [Vibrio parahaemolyticus]|nr:hypothetical protein [Vibrio parahaemolyticus]